METIEDIINRFMDELMSSNCQEYEEVEELLYTLFSEGYLEGFKAALTERVETDLITLKYMNNEK